MYGDDGRYYESEAAWEYAYDEGCRAEEMYRIYQMENEDFADIEQVSDEVLRSTGDDENALDAFTTLLKECEDYGVEQLINATYFKSYAMELAEDCGMIDHNAPWPQRHIDWDAAVEELKMDYTEFSSTFYGRE
jgi:hypothetical protein